MESSEAKARALFVSEVAGWIRDKGFDAALNQYTGFIQSRLDEGVSEKLLPVYFVAWSDAVKMADNPQ